MNDIMQWAMPMRCDRGTQRRCLRGEASPAEWRSQPCRPAVFLLQMRNSHYSLNDHLSGCPELKKLCFWRIFNKMATKGSPARRSTKMLALSLAVRSARPPPVHLSAHSARLSAAQRVLSLIALPLTPISPSLVWHSGAYVVRPAVVSQPVVRRYAASYLAPVLVASLAAAMLLRIWLAASATLRRAPRQLHAEAARRAPVSLCAAAPSA